MERERRSVRFEPATGATSRVALFAWWRTRPLLALVALNVALVAGLTGTRVAGPTEDATGIFLDRARSSADARWAASVVARPASLTDDVDTTERSRGPRARSSGTGPSC
jgi:hypothetical protein